MRRESVNVNLMRIRAQGATEYLLMLAVVLIIIAAAVFFLMGATPGALISGIAENSGDDIIFTPSNSMIPATIPAADWEYAVYRDATEIVGFTAGTEDLNRGESISLSAPGVADGDTLKIRYKEKDVYDILII